MGVDWDRGMPRGAAPPTPPGIRFRNRGGSTELSLGGRIDSGETERIGIAVNAGLVLNPTYTISPYAAVRIAILPTCALSVMRWNARGASAKANRSEMHGSRPFAAMARIIASRLSRGPQVTPCNRTCR